MCSNDDVILRSVTHWKDKWLPALSAYSFFNLYRSLKQHFVPELNPPNARCLLFVEIEAEHISGGQAKVIRF